MNVPGTKRGQKLGRNRGRHPLSAGALHFRATLGGLGLRLETAARRTWLSMAELEGLLSGRLTVPAERWGSLWRKLYGS